jgi:hypothetical protein
MSDDARAYTRDVPLTALIEDSTFSQLFLPDPTLIKAITADMRSRGFDPLQPIHVWKDVPRRAQHTILEGHQRFAAAARAGLEAVKVAYHDFDSREAALLWAYQQQAGRRNIPREVMCLSILRALHTEGTLASSTTKALAKQLQFSTPTIDRARLLLKHGTQAEILEVLEEKHGLKEAYDRLRKRRGTTTRKETDPLPPGGPKPKPALAKLRTALAVVIDGGLIEHREALKHARWLYDWFDGQAPGVDDEDDD